MILKVCETFPHLKLMNQKNDLTFRGCVAYWLATCARKPKAPSSSPAATYVQR